MKKMNFILKDNNNIICDDYIDFKDLNGQIHLDVLDSKIFFESRESGFVFKKCNRQQEFVIEHSNICSQSYIYLLDENIKFPLEVNVVEYSKGDKTVIIKYVISSDPENLKTIEFRY